MVGTIINAVTIIFCSIIGLLFKKALPQRFCETITQGMGLGIMIIGISMALKTQNIIILLVSLLFGAVIGELLNIEKQLKRLGDRLGSKMKKKDNTISQGFVTASLLFCTGSMGIMGAIENGLTGTYGILLSKSLLDGIFSIIFASTMGIGVLFSAIPVFLYQGGITLLAGSIKTLLSAGMINEMNAVGGVLIFAIGINMVKIKNLKIGNLLPAIVMPILIIWVMGLFGI